MEQKITVEYRTRKEYCHCCEQKLPNPKTSDIREFNFSKDTLYKWGGNEWKEIIEFEDDLDEFVRECVYETISFFSTSWNEKIIIEKSQFDKVKQFVLDELMN